MRLTKSLLSIICSAALATGAAFAGGGSTSHEGSLSHEDQMSLLEESDREMLAESDVIYIYPMQVTEYYLLVPSHDDKTWG